MKNILLYFIFSMLLTLIQPMLARSQVFTISSQEALKSIFKTSTDIYSEKKTLSLDQKKQIESQLGYRLKKDSWNFFVAKSGHKIDGYALIDNEIGKTEPITFLTAIHPDGKIKDVEIIAFRETHGGQVRDDRFTRQYHGKKITDPVRTGQDIKNISGATLSARSISVGVKRALILWQVFYGS